MLFITPSRVDTVPGFEWLTLIGIDQNLTVNLLHLLFSVLVGLYYTALRLFNCRGELPSEGLHLLLRLPVDDFGVRRSVRAGSLC